MEKEPHYYCGPQSWPQWLRKPLSRFYNRACRDHDNDYSDPECDFEEAEVKFDNSVTRKRKALHKAWHKKKINTWVYIKQAVLIGYSMPVLTKKFGRFFK